MSSCEQPDPQRASRATDVLAGGFRRRGRLPDAKALQRENFELKRANDIRGNASAYFAQAALDRRGK